MTMLHVAALLLFAWHLAAVRQDLQWPEDLGFAHGLSFGAPIRIRT